MTNTFQNTHDHYLAAFESLSAEAGWPSWLKQVRESAAGRFAELGFPTSRNEEWKYTNVAPIARQAFKTAGPSADKVSLKSLQAVSIPGLEGPRLVFVNGRFSRKLSALGRLPKGLSIRSLAQVLAEKPAWLEAHLAKHASFQENPFVALNTALHRDGACVLVDGNVVISEPVHLLFLSSGAGEPWAAFPRNLILLSEGSRLALVEHYAGLNGGGYFTNAVTEIVQGENTVVDYCKLQAESGSAFHVATVQMRQARGSSLTAHSISMGGGLVRNDINTVLDGEGAECTLNGLYVIGGDQHEDNHTRIEHAKPHCTSHELYKGVLDGRSTGVFSGKIFVHQNAQKTDAKQTNKNLIRSEDASMNTKPQLEIFADDVKCTHGATIGQLDEDSVFYLRTRGIGEQEARNMLTCAFARDIIDRVTLEPIRDKLESSLMARLESHSA